MRAIIRVILSETTDVEVMELRKKIQELVKDKPKEKVDIEVSIMGR